jgi:hypothetical protein
LPLGLASTDGSGVPTAFASVTPRALLYLEAAVALVGRMTGGGADAGGECASVAVFGAEAVGDDGLVVGGACIDVVGADAPTGVRSSITGSFTRPA